MSLQMCLFSGSFKKNQISYVYLFQMFTIIWLTESISDGKYNLLVPS